MPLSKSQKTNLKKFFHLARILQGRGVYYSFQKQGNETTIFNYRMEEKTMGITIGAGVLLVASFVVEAICLSS